MINTIQKYFLLLFLAVIVTVSGVQPVAAQIAWDVNSIKLVLPLIPDSWDSYDASAPHVLYDNGVYHMWYKGQPYRGSSAPDAIGYASSSDGVHWTQRQIVHGPANGSRQTGAPYVIQEEEIYRMWHYDYYETIAGDWSGYIAHLESSDGIHWGHEQKVLSAQGQIAPQGDGYHIDHAAVLQEGVRYMMWYTVDDHPGPGRGGPKKIWYAESNDGIHWGNRQLALPYILGTWEEEIRGVDVIADGQGGYIMYYSGNNWLGMAFSDDGIHWTDRQQIGVRGLNPTFFLDRDGTPYLYFDYNHQIYRIGGMFTPDEADVMLNNWAFNLNGDIYQTGSALTASFDDSNFDWNTGFGTITLVYRPGDPGNYFLTTFFDYIIDASIASYFDQYGSTSGTLANGQSWQIGGEAYNHAIAGQLTNTNFVPSSNPGAVSLALGWDFYLDEGDWAEISVSLTDSFPPDEMFALAHTITNVSGDWQTSVYLSSDLQIHAVPEPSTVLLLCFGLPGILAARKRLMDVRK